MAKVPPVSLPLQQILNADEVPKFSSVVASAFLGDALNRYLYLGRESRPDHPKFTDEQFDLRVQYWEKIIRPRFETAAILVQSHDWAAVALWFPPGVEKPPMRDLSTLSEGVAQYLTYFKGLREEKLGTRPHWHLNIIARDPKRDDKGAITALFNPYLQAAKEENLPVWLEATNAHARQVYEYFGFKVVGEVLVGKGIANSNGYVEEGGDGVLVWGMIAGLDGW
ncbi:hypothetical protein BDV96DRAFT_640639 [Lophiotrema nucula]|uniref:Uncharacterized protein n=1 Tax=Lophiotrema nucula TaxID=690887 RepID=A0A6A5ZQH3_9PLEO|nr:hypothetical protein BDV96DRAFT_640639 [Lophiotrema nucula]